MFLIYSGKYKMNECGKTDNLFVLYKRLAYVVSYLPVFYKCIIFCEREFSVRNEA